MEKSSVAFGRGRYLARVTQIALPLWALIAFPLLTALISLVVGVFAPFMLRRSGVEARVTAIELAAEAQPDVALVDLSLPGADGLETTRRLRERAPSVKVVVISGLSGGGEATAAQEAGATGFLFKGGLHDEIADAIVDAHSL